MSDPVDQTANYEEDDGLDAGLAAAFGPGASVVANLSQSLPGLRRVQLRESPDIGSGHVEKPNSHEVPPSSATGRYQVFGEIARGGMGAILRGRDPDLGRDIAIKVLREDHRDNPRMIERFVEEAQIGGQLQHPGILPVYELNQFSDHRPYFTMKLVKGRTLAVLFRDRRDLTDNRATLVSIFAQVAQTVAYAHSRGVIHRDLKPANVMIGNFGEVQVVDWGLAKVLPAGGIADEERSQKDARSRAAFVNAVSQIKTLRSTGSGSETMAGSLLGTPSYMAPEQARGDQDLIDERSDVFGLGAILCELLTGKPPFTGETPAEIQRKAGLGQLDDAMLRLKEADADEELTNLARRCLAAEPWDRPRDAKAVADAASAHLAAADERLRRAERERAVAEMQAIEERKRRRVGMALAASILLTLGMAGAGAWWWHDRREAAARADEIARATASSAVERGLTEAEQYRASGHWVEAQLAARKAAEFLPEDAEAGLKKRVAEIQADLKLLIALDENRIQFSGERQEVFDADGAQAAYVAAFRGYGVDIETLDPAMAQSRFSQAIHIQVAEALDHWAQTRVKYFNDTDGWKRLMSIAQAVDASNPWRTQLRSARLNQEAPKQLALARSPDRLKQPPTILVVLARNLRDGFHEPAVALEVLQEARLRFPGDFWINYELGETCMTLNRHGEAVRYFNAALAARPENTFVMTSVAWALSDLSQWKESEVICRHVTQIQPGFHWAHGLLGYVLHHQQQNEEAITETRKAMELSPTSWWWMNNLGSYHNDLKHLAEAEEYYRKALVLTPEAPMPLQNLTRLLQEQNRKEEITKLCRDMVGRQPNSLLAHINLAKQSGDTKDYDDAIACFRRKLAKGPLDADTVNPLADALRQNGRKPDAFQVLREAIPTSRDSSKLLVKLAFDSTAPADIDAALANLREELKTNHPRAGARNNLASFLRMRRRYAEAEAVVREAIRLTPDDRQSYLECNHILTDMGRRTEAVIVVRDGLTHLPNDSELWYFLGFHLQELGRPREALDALQRAVQLDQNRRLAWNLLGFSRLRLGDFVGASDAMAQARDAAKRVAPDYDQAGDIYVKRAKDMVRLVELESDLPAIVDG
ncbi:MAG: protein kinase domain-containing protein [Gemmataceae bacterium]